MKKDLEYILSSRKYILIMTGLFIISVIAGLVASLKDLGLSENYLEMMKNSFGWIKNLSPIGIMLVIFLNNALKSLLAILLGAGFGIIPLIFVGGNGILLGLIANQVSSEKGTLFVLAAILPHGIIEIPMVLLSSGLGLRLGYLMYSSIMGKETDMKSELRQSLRIYVRIIMPLLFVSAVVETFVTPMVVLQVMP
ncbi:MAG: stage II sporulation protein M [Candidatus Methanoperedens sp.]|nr:stage II sporulation protein M [Candidatus Methanoperedens sp.]